MCADPPPPAADDTAPRSDPCTATLATGGPCKYRACHSLDGDRLCGVHMRQRELATECPVCLGPIKKRAKSAMACGHEFHSKCIRAWFRQRPLTCPMCRAACLEGMALLGPRLAPKLLALTRTLPPPPRAFFPAYIVSHLENPRVQEALGADKSLAELLVDLACECFTRDNFFAKIRGLGL